MQSLAEHPRVVTLRDSTTVEELVSRLPSLRKIVLVGNGGIALELVHALNGLQVHLKASALGSVQYRNDNICADALD